VCGGGRGGGGGGGGLFEVRGVEWGGLEGCKSSRVASIQSGFSPLAIMHGIRGQDPVCLIARTNKITL